MTRKHPDFSAAGASHPYAAHLYPLTGALPAHIEAALEISARQTLELPGFDAVCALQEPGYQSIENGYVQNADGSIHVAALTHMPGVTPRMWDWWFGWHGSSNQRYQLWHPQAHISARWKDGSDETAYIGRVSIIEEYIGAQAFPAAIQFKSPTEFGFSLDALKEPDACVYICARVGHPVLPVDYGYLVHQVRAVEGGAEMRSRFWMGGPYLRLRPSGLLARAASRLLRKLRSLPVGFAPDLLRHCAEEMNHLAAILPALYTEYHKETAVFSAQNLEKQPNATDAPKQPDTPSESLTVSGGTVLDKSSPDFEATVMGTLFNKIDPGRRPSKVVIPHNEQDIIDTLRYARRTGMKVTVCSGGHSFSANHLREGSILILMKNFNQYKIDPESMTATAGPGVGGSVLMTELFKHKLFFPAGHCKGVCIGGYLLQGGYGWNGRKTGIACQSVTALDIITADGELVHASATENTDLYWAARGSGPGFFGIVVRFHLQLYPLPPYRAIIAHDFNMKHLDDVFHWAYEVGPSIPKAVEFQMIMSNNMLNLLGPGIEALAPIFADTRDEFEDAMNFMKNSPVKKKAIIATPAFDPGIDMLYKGTMEHYPENAYWGVDNMWTHAPIDDLLPYIREIARTLPPPPSHALWLNWHPGSLMADMAYSKEDQIYIALYANWKNAADTPKYADWAANMMRKMEHLATGIQLADEGLHKRKASFMSTENFERLQQIRSRRDPDGVFYPWHGL